jgi:endonuclease/exonuclease/phosphatase family metal-dependent hydrolase
MQEVLHSQLYDILGSLNNINESSIETGAGHSLPEGPLWSHIGVAREDGKMKGEYSPILYPTQIFNLLHFENTWLSPTPDKPSKGWDAGSERILTSGVFEHKLTNTRLAVFNTHLDNAGTEAREKSVGIILSVIERISSEWRGNTNGESFDSSIDGLDYVLAGDFNSFPTQEAYKAMVKSNKTVDVHATVPVRARYGNENTFTGFEPDTDKDKAEIGRIDFVWLGPRERVRDRNAESMGSRGWHVQGYSVLPNIFDDGVFCSDHRCVVADAVLI